jgi:hypothetical protein
MASRDAVALVLAVVDLLGQAHRVGVLLEHPVQEVGRHHRVVRRCVEEREELGGTWAQRHRCLQAMRPAVPMGARR